MLKQLLITSMAILTANLALAAPAPYVGAGLGITINTSPNNEGVGNFRGVPLNLFVGYGGMANESFYLAGELEGTIATPTLSGHDNSLKTSYGYGASIIPGVMLSDHTLAFARAGVVRSHFPRFNHTATGGKMGLGLQTTLTQNIDLRGEYDFTAYRTVDDNYARVNARGDTVNFSLIYKFE